MTNVSTNFCVFYEHYGYFGNINAMNAISEESCKTSGNFSSHRNFTNQCCRQLGQETFSVGVRHKSLIWVLDANKCSIFIGYVFTHWHSLISL
jgi:hypothetical protein